ncbi:asparaginyl tRNA synthetase [Wigglesworthia glossinidia endosymbiont of Glossina morsitans morsitans (Yale colony)]|uniref:Asparagine--tRNA ligase n=1 Tax=Wigglesworthia glossinidia endosymbiont of Glossina morsitans morsitans (Yale colony) TaxID=1142511 RepID=H6Q552_WIGGL|nr:asparagine--tRNA ligase [Wigglesworthia glossinidia]AFA41335.1 asparaginyl tRNA synthetase [Wigglesworthia glossinidia endosymbiont of Glossina morsitans morsitans (Yale colony)]
MKLTTIIDIFNKKILTSQIIFINAWVRNKRDSKIGISFIDIYDGSCFKHIQVIANKDLKNYKKDILQLTSGCSVCIEGIVQKSINKDQLEIYAKSIKIIGNVFNPETYPIAPKSHTLEYLRNLAHLRPRTNIIGAITRIRHFIAQEIHTFLSQQGFLWISTPLITALNTEGSGEMFCVSTLNFEDIPKNLKGKVDYKKDFFGKKTFLTVSGQLHLESYACALSKVYTFGPTFRAENSNTTRHLAEFWMIEIEAAFLNLDEIILFAYKMLKNIFKNVLGRCFDDLIFLEKKTNTNLINRMQQFIVSEAFFIEYTEAIKIINNSTNYFKSYLNWGEDFSSEHEKYLSDIYYKKPIVIKNYPKKIKAFYMRLNQDQKTVASADILLPGIGEIIGGSQREERWEQLNLRLKENNLNPENYNWYQDLRRYGTVPHSGFGLGLERLLSYVTGIKNVRDLIPFPRTPKYANF